MSTPGGSSLPAQARTRRGLVTFLVIAFAISWSLFLVPLLFGAPGSQAHTYARLVAFTAAMWGPGVAAMIVVKRAGGSIRSSLGMDRFGGKRYYVWAWLAFPVLAVVTGVATWALGLGTFDPELTAIREAMTGAPGGDAVSPWVVVAIQVVASLTLAPVVNVAFALGEELGWRAFLLPALEGEGTGRAIAIVGVVWGIWHAPAILQGHNYPEHPYLGVLLMTLATLALGAILAWLYLRTRSVWAPALGHGAVNAVAGLPMLVLVDVDFAFGGMLLSLVGSGIMGLFVLWLYATGRLGDTRADRGRVPVGRGVQPGS